MRVGSFDSGQQAANPESPQHTGHALATIVDHLSNQNSHRLIAQESGFRRNVKFATFEEADGLCKNIHTWGKTCTPGGQERPKVAPLTWNRFSIEHNSGSQCHRKGRAHLTQTTNQHLRIIVKLSSHALATI